jgi:hypothetical protein
MYIGFVLHILYAKEYIAFSIYSIYIVANDAQNRALLATLCLKWDPTAHRVSFVLHSTHLIGHTEIEASIASLRISCASCCQESLMDLFNSEWIKSGSARFAYFSIDMETDNCRKICRVICQKFCILCNTQIIQNNV